MADTARPTVPLILEASQLLDKRVGWKQEGSFRSFYVTIDSKLRYEWPSKPGKELPTMTSLFEITVLAFEYIYPGNKICETRMSDNDLSLL